MPAVARLAVFIVALAGVAPASAANLSMFDPAGPSAASIRELLMLVSAIAAVIFVVVIGTLIYCVIRFRERSATRAAEPPQIYGSNPIETAWTVGPILIVFVLTLVIIRTVVEARQADLQPGAMTVRVIGHQWWWEFEYPEQGVVAANEMHIPVSSPKQRQPIRLQLESADVIHSFWAPRLAGKTDLIPGRINNMWIEGTSPGVFHGQCAEFCGTQHANMLIRVVVESREEFERWAAAQRQPAVSDESVAAGRSLFMAKTCANCHTIRGTPAAATVGPDLTHFRSRETIAACELPNTRANLERWLADPAAVKPGCRMPNLNLPKAEIDAIVSYLETLR